MYSNLIYLIQVCWISAGLLIIGFLLGFQLVIIPIERLVVIKELANPLTVSNMISEIHNLSS